MSQSAIKLPCLADTYRHRRARLAAGLRQPLLVFAGHAGGRSYPTNEWPFRAACNYLYLGGPPLQHAALLIEPGSDGSTGTTWFRVPPGPDDAVWFGAQPGDDVCAAAAGLDRDSIRGVDQLAAFIEGKQVAAIVAGHARTLAQARALGLGLANDETKRLLVDMRLIKDEEELAAMRRATVAGVAAHKAAMQAAQPGRREWDVQAALVAELTRHGCRNSFSPIVTQRGEVLHGASDDVALQPGRLLLVDAGAEEPGGYTSDMTRTYPVGGEWTDIQRTLYTVVLEAQQAAIKACVVGARYRDVHHCAARRITRGLVEADLLRGDADELFDRGAYGLFFCHGVGHLIGLGVHDMEDFGDLAGYAAGRTRATRFGDNFLRLDRDLEAGMAVTIEPGLYLVPEIWAREDLAGPFAGAVNREHVNALLAQNFGGIRIEEDIVVRPTGGPEVLTADLPNDPDAVTALVGSGR